MHLIVGILYFHNLCSFDFDVLQGAADFSPSIKTLHSAMKHLKLAIQTERGKDLPGT